MHEDILSADQVAVLDGLSTVPAIGSFYLAGGTAPALRYGHRRSIDFDFFRTDVFDSRQLTADLARSFDPIERLPTAEDTLYVRLNGVSTSFFRLRHPLLEPAEPVRWGFGLASDLDLAAMKLEAVAGRVSRKDFIDLWWLCHQGGLSMEQVFDAFERRYGTQRTERYHRLRALSYLDDARREPMPDVTTRLPWDDVEAFFDAEVTRLLEQGWLT